jgi:hypothetical protein
MCLERARALVGTVCIRQITHTACQSNTQPTTTISQQLPDRSRVVRVMPNTPCLVGESAAAFALGENCLPEDAAVVKRIFSSVGLAVEVKEKDLNGAWVGVFCLWTWTWVFVLPSFF